MALSAEATATLQTARERVADWHDKKVEEIEETAAFLRSVETPTETASSTVASAAVAETRTLIDSILAP